MRAEALLTLSVSVAALAASSQTLPRTGTLVIRDVRVFDGERVIPGATVVVRGDRIVDVGRRVPIPKGAEVMDGQGRTLLPGFFDSHTHTDDREALRQALVFGVTTQLDMFTDVGFMQRMRQEQTAGAAADRADLLAAGIGITAPGGHGTQFGVVIPTLSSPGEADAFVEARIKEGSDYVKVILEAGVPGRFTMPTLSRETYAAVVRAAHQRGKMAVTHVTSQEHARWAIEAGSDGLVHVYDQGRPDRDLARLAKRGGTFVVPTLSVEQSFAAIAGGAKVADDSRLSPYLPESSDVNLRMTFPGRPNLDKYAVAREMVKILNEEGVPILAGSDVPNSGTAYGASLHGELELLVEAGLTPVEALRSATSVPAKAFSVTDRGLIRPGLRADLFLVRGDPTRDITSTRDIEAVWKAGVRADRAAFLTKVREARDIAAGERQAPAPPGSDSGHVSDFEDGTTAARFGAGWSISTDALAGGGSKAEMTVVDDGAEGSKRALKVGGEIATGTPDPWAGVMFSPGPETMAAANLSSKKAISFWAKGDGKRHRILLFSRHRGPKPLVSTFLAGAEWARRVIPIGFDGMDGRDIQAVVFAGGPQAGPFAFLIDDVRIE